MQYTSKALRAHEESVRKSKAVASAREAAVARRAFEMLEAKADERRRRIAEERLTSLPPSDYQTLFAKVKTDLFARSHWVPQDENSIFFKRLIHGAMVGELMRPGNYSEPADPDPNNSR
jgi:hypothetical protein